MTLRDLAPEWLDLPLAELMAVVAPGTLYGARAPVAAWYDEALPLWRVLGYYGSEVHPEDETMMLRCQLASHGSTDEHKSACYYARDRRTGTGVAKIHCFRCKTQHSAFWYVNRMERDLHRASLPAVYLHIERVFGVAYPRGILFDFDPAAAAEFGDGPPAAARLASAFALAAAVRALQRTDPLAFGQALMALHRGASAD